MASLLPCTGVLTPTARHEAIVTYALSQKARTSRVHVTRAQVQLLQGRLQTTFAPTRRRVGWIGDRKCRAGTGAAQIRDTQGPGSSWFLHSPVLSSYVRSALGHDDTAHVPYAGSK